MLNAGEVYECPKYSVTQFRQNADAMIKDVAETGSPVVLTQSGGCGSQPSKNEQAKARVLGTHTALSLSHFFPS